MQQLGLVRSHGLILRRAMMPIFAWLLVLLVPVNAHAAAALDEVEVSPLAGGRLQIDLRMSGDVQEPGIFRTNQPSRLILDLFDTTSELDQSVIRVGQGAVESIVTAETPDRTRLIFNLVGSASYETEVTAQGITLVLGAAGADVPNVELSTPVLPRVAGATEAAFEVLNVDFRRTPAGGGRVIVTLSDPTISIDVREESGEIIADIIDARLIDGLERRLDVMDFATPVQFIDAFNAGNNSRIVVSPVGRYSQSSYQVADTLTIEIAPIVEGEEEREADEFGYTGERLSLNFQNITTRAALQVIADFTGLNFVTSDAVGGNLSLRLQDVPWDQALDTILQVKGLAMRQRGNVIWVAPAEEIAAKERQALEAQQQVNELEPLVSELIQINYARADDIASLLRSVRAVDPGIQQSVFGSVSVGQVDTEENSLLSERGNVTVDTRTNSILIQDTAPKIREIRKLIAKLDKPVKQVLIETRIVEAEDDFSRNIGVKLGFTKLTADTQFPGESGLNLGTTAASGSLTNTNDVLESGVSPAGGPNGLSVDLGADGISGQDPASYAFTIAKAGAGYAALLDLEISALEAEGRGKIIANPRLLTADQQQARIEQGQERIFTTSVLGEGSVVTKKAVLSLTVTPQITPDDRLVLDVLVTQDSFVSPTDPTINTKQVDTQVLLDNGETVVIGGIYQQQTGETVTKVPFLGDIPGLGWFFKKKSILDNRVELLVFLTPRIINPALTSTSGES